MIKSFWSKLIVIRDTISYQYPRNLSLVSSNDKFKLILLLGFNRLTNEFYNSYSFKRGGFSISFQTFTFYKACLDRLFKMSFFPFVETNIDKSLIAARPYRFYCDIPIELKKYLSQDDRYCCFSFKIYHLSSHACEAWIHKNSPLNVNLFMDFLYNFDYNHTLKFSESFYSVFFNFIINGMLWISI